MRRKKYINDRIFYSLLGMENINAVILDESKNIVAKVLTDLKGGTKVKYSFLVYKKIVDGKEYFDLVEPLNGKISRCKKKIRTSVSLYPPYFPSGREIDEDKIEFIIHS